MWDITYEFQVSSTVNIYKNITTINMQIYSYTGGAHYIREDKSMIRNDDLIMRFENVYNDHNYKIEFKYNVATE